MHGRMRCIHTDLANSQNGKFVSGSSARGHLVLPGCRTSFANFSLCHHTAHVTTMCCTLQRAGHSVVAILSELLLLLLLLLPLL